jgi:hypothetical protein
MRAGGYVRIKDDLLLWQDLASQLGLPAWPCAEVPDPLRALQQVYRDYLLRFEGRFSIPEQPAAAAAGVLQSPSLSTATQYPSSQQQQQQMGGMNVAAAAAMLQGGQGYAMPSGTTGQQQQQVLQASGECAAPAAAAAATADNNNFNNSLLQPGQQRLQTQFSLSAGMVLDDTFSGDLFDLLTDLIPDNDAVLPAASSNGMQQQQPMQMAAAGQQQQQQQQAAQQGADAAAALDAPLQRQHPEMTLVQQRHRLQQLQAQLQQQQQQQQGLAAAAADAQLGAAAARAKRPPPLIRCGDSDVVSLMDQTDVSRLLRDYDQQQRQASTQQAQQQQHPALRQQHQSPLRQQQQGAAGGVPPRPAASQLAAAIAGAVDRAQSKDLQQLMQSYWQRQGGQQQQQQQGAAQAQQQQQQVGQAGQEGAFEPPLEPQAADEEMSGMLEALQLAADGQPVAGQQQRVLAAAGNAFELSGKDEGAHAGHLMPASANLLAQGSVGAHLVGLMPQSTAQDGSSEGNQQGSMLPPPSSQAMAAPPPRPSSAAAAAACGINNNSNNGNGQQQQNGATGLQAFEGGLLRLTTPNSAIIGSVLDSPTLRSAVGGSGAGWMDISEQMLPVRTLSNDLRSMTVELTGAAGDGQCGPNADDLAAVLQMW